MKDPIYWDLLVVLQVVKSSIARRLEDLGAYSTRLVSSCFGHPLLLLFLSWGMRSTRVGTVGYSQVVEEFGYFMTSAMNRYKSWYWYFTRHFKR